MKPVLFALLALLTAGRAAAQQHNPLINSGELIKEGIALHDKEKYKEAIAVYARIPASDTNYYLALYEMALSQWQDSQYVAAVQSARLGLSKENDKWPDFYTVYGNATDDMGQPEQAIRIYDSALRLYPAFADLYLNKGTTQLKLERYDDAIATLQQCLLLNPYLPGAHYKLGLCAFRKGLLVQAMLSEINCLLLQPNGRWKSGAITLLSNISKGTDEIRELADKRSTEPPASFVSLEKIILSRMALDKRYEPLIKLDDAISRQIQVLFEKLEYDETESDFWMQYYVPFYASLFKNGKFEPFVYRLFAGVNLDVIQDYVKKKDKPIQEVIDLTVAYYNQVRETRELSYATRYNMKARYHFENGRLYGKGRLADDGETALGDWEYYYGPGNIRSRGAYNEEGKRIGKWEYFYFSGKKRGEQTYRDGLLEGPERFFFDNGNRSTEASFRNNEEEGISRSYFFVGPLKTEGGYRAGLKEGVRKTFYTCGQVQAVENYRNDTLQGAFVTYHLNGRKDSEGNFLNGELDGPFKSYHENGQLSIDAPYRKGKLHGILRQYHENGKLKSEKTFADGEAEGTYKEYYNNGQLYYTCQYRKGKINGDVEHLDRDGKRFFIFSYDNDVVKSARYYNGSGQEAGQSERKNRKLLLTTHYSDGYRRSVAEYNDKGEINGPETWYYRSGNLSGEYVYEDGQMNGPAVSYYPGGQKQYQGSYAAGEKDGYHQYWYSNGKLQEEGWYRAGKMEGTWLTYNELGQLTGRIEYQENDYNGDKTEYFPTGKPDNFIRYSKGWIERFVQYDTTGKILHTQDYPGSSGPFRVLHLNGKTYAEGRYEYGDLEGEYKFYFFDGKLSTRQFFRHGKLDSTYTSYYYNGKTASEGSYSWGRKTGTWKTYRENGKLHFSEEYEQGELHGTKKQYHENGKLSGETQLENGENHGWSKRYDEDGSLAYQVRFSEGLPVAYTYTGRDGKLVPEIPIPGGTGEVKAFYANGKPSADFAYKDGKLQGINKLYFSNGKTAMEGQEVYGVSEGVYRHYYASGQLKFEYPHVHDNLHGFYREYHANGKLSEEGYFYNGQPHDTMKIYDETGKLKETRRYYYGRLLSITL